MKILKFLLAYCILASLFACSHSMTSKAQKPCSENSWARYVQLKVLKVFSATDGDAIYKSYLVKWKDQEVVAGDTLARTDYREGDIITVIAMAHSFPDEKEAYGLLCFEVAPPEVVEKLRKRNCEPGGVGDSPGQATTEN